MKNIYAFLGLALCTLLTDVSASTSCVTANVQFPGTSICPSFTAWNVPFCAMNASDASNQAMNIVSVLQSQFSSNATLLSNLGSMCTSLGGSLGPMAIPCPGPNWFPATCTALNCSSSGVCCSSLQSLTNSICNGASSAFAGTTVVPAAFISAFPQAPGTCATSGCTLNFIGGPNPLSDAGLLNSAGGVVPWNAALLAGAPTYGMPIFRPVPNCDVSLQNTLTNYTFTANFFGSVWDGSMLFKQNWTLGHSSLLTSFYDIDDILPAMSISVTRPDAPTLPGSLYVRDTNGDLTYWSIGNTTIDAHWHAVVVINTGAGYVAILDGEVLPQGGWMAAPDATVMSAKNTTAWGTPARSAVIIGPFYGALAQITATNNVLDIPTASLVVPGWMMQGQGMNPQLAYMDGTYTFNVATPPNEIMAFGALGIFNQTNSTVYGITVNCQTPSRIHAVDDVLPDGFLTTAPIPANTIKIWPGDSSFSMYVDTTTTYIHQGTNGGYNAGNASWANRPSMPASVNQNVMPNPSGNATLITGTAAFFVTIHSWADELVPIENWGFGYLFSNNMSASQPPPPLNSTLEQYDGYKRILRLLSIPMNTTLTSMFKSQVMNWMWAPIPSVFNISDSMAQAQFYGTPPAMGGSTLVGQASSPQSITPTGVGLLDTAATINAMFASNGWCLQWSTIASAAASNQFTCTANTNAFC